MPKHPTAPTAFAHLVPIDPRRPVGNPNSEFAHLGGHPYNAAAVAAGAEARLAAYRESSRQSALASAAKRDRRLAREASLRAPPAPEDRSRQVAAEIVKAGEKRRGERL